MVLRDGDREQVDHPARLQRMDHAQRHHVVRIVAHVRVENQLHGLRLHQEHRQRPYQPTPFSHRVSFFAPRHQHGMVRL
jgi:hypothetical protein